MAFIDRADIRAVLGRNEVAKGQESLVGEGFRLEER
jgi:hypothetical protein